MKKYKGPKPGGKTECFSIAVYRLDNGYCAKARVLTNKGYVDFASSATREDYVIGAIEEPPKMEVINEVLDQAAAFAQSALGRQLVPGHAKYAILSTQVARDASTGVMEGDRDSARTLQAMKNSDSSTLRKASKIAGLLEE